MITDKSTTKPVHAHGLTAATRDIGTLINRAIAAEVEARNTAIADAMRPLADQLGSEAAAREALERRISPSTPSDRRPAADASCRHRCWWHRSRTCSRRWRTTPPDIMLRDGIYPIDPAGARAARSWFFGDRFAHRTTRRPHRPGDARRGLLDGRGASYFGAYTFDQGVHDLTIGPGFTIDNGTATSTGVIVFGSANGAASRRAPTTSPCLDHEARRQAVRLALRSEQVERQRPRRLLHGQPRRLP